MFSVLLTINFHFNYYISQVLQIKCHFLFIYLFIYLSIHLYIYLFIHLYIYLFIYLSTNIAYYNLLITFSYGI